MNIWITKIFPVSTVFVFAYVKHSRLDCTIASFSFGKRVWMGWLTFPYFSFKGKKKDEGNNKLK